MKSAIIAAWLAAELFKLPGSHAPNERPEEYRARIVDIATAEAEEAIPYATGQGWTATELAAAGSIIWHGETLLDRRIHAGEPHPKWTEDHHLARCGMQLHMTGIVPQDVWERLAGLGTDETHLCAQYGLRVVVAQARQCGVWAGQRADRRRVAMTFAGYASGGRCVPTDRDWERADRWVRMMATRPDHERKKYPGFRRAAPGEVPETILVSARGIVAGIGKEPEVVPGYERHEAAAGRRYALVVERHAEGRVGVSVLVQE